VTAAPGRIRLRVRRVAREALDINSYELVDPEGGALPPFTAGAHIDLYLPGGLLRQYSLCNDPAERYRYLIAAQKESTSRGGSQALFERVYAGDVLPASRPRNRFALVENARRTLLLAGGIGVAPLLSMAARLSAIGADFVLHYCTRSPQHAAFREALAPLAEAGRVVTHHDGGEPSKRLDIARMLSRREPGAHLYYCGPREFMRAVGQAARHWPAAALHCETFAPAEAEGGESGLERFAVRVAKSGRVYPVGPEQSILDALGEAGVPIESPCQTGTCGLCRRPYLAGEPAHHDALLTESERREFVILCRARSKTPMLVIDL
jgi:ferredoxin-NADP reductase